MNLADQLINFQHNIKMVTSYGSITLTLANVLTHVSIYQSNLLYAVNSSLSKRLLELALSLQWGIWFMLVRDGPLFDTSTSHEPTG